jgi:adenosine kinase
MRAARYERLALAGAGLAAALVGSSRSNGAAMHSGAAPRPLLLAVGNAVVDHTLLVDDAELERELGVRPGSNLTRAPPELRHLLLERVRAGGSAQAGGSAMSAARAAAQASRHRGSALRVGFVGAVGVDAGGDLVRRALERSGVEPLLHASRSSGGTGECAILVDRATRERTICCVRGASAALSVATAQAQLAHWPPGAGMVFAESYLVTTDERFAVVEALASRQGALSLSLSSAELLAKGAEARARVRSLVGRATLVLGTVEEARALLLLPPLADAAAAATATVALQPRGALCVLTQGGAGPVVVASAGAVRAFPLGDRKSAAEIVDTNGAGDAFAGGFLAELALRGGFDRAAAAPVEPPPWPLVEACVQAGQRCAVLSLAAAGVADDLFASDTTNAARCC